MSIRLKTLPEIALEDLVDYVQKYPALPVKPKAIELANRYKINHFTLLTKFQRLKSKQSSPARDYHHGLCKLSLTEESLLLGFILAFDNLGMPITPQIVRELVLLGLQISVSPAWVTLFLERNKSCITYKVVKQIEIARLDSAQDDRIEEWLARHELFLQNHYFPAFARFNVDEGRMTFKPDPKGITATGKGKRNKLASRIKTIGTMVPFISADGSLFYSHYIVKSGKGKSATVWKHSIPKSSRGDTPHKFRPSETGCVSKVLWKDIMKSFATEWELHHPGLHCIVYMDNCAIHRFDKDLSEDLTDNFVLEMAQRGMHCCIC